MKLMDDYPERVVVGFAFWPFVSLLNFTLVRRRAVPINLRHHLHHLHHHHLHHHHLHHHHLHLHPIIAALPALQVPRRFHLLVLNLAGFLWGVISSYMA